MQWIAKTGILILLLGGFWLVTCQGQGEDSSGEIFSCTCPTDCSCDDFVVDCSKRGLKDIPLVLSQCNWDTIKTLDLSGNSISTVPENAFVGLSRLLNLYLYSSQVSEVHPNAFAGLATLLLLSLDDNLITTLAIGTFQPVPLLRTVLLHENLLTSTGLSPGVFDNLQQLEILSLHLNQLTTVNYLFQNLTKLQELYLFSNRISSIDGLGPISNLHTLYLSSNRITEITNSTFSGFNSLQTLYLDANEIRFITRECFQHLTNLRILNIAGNNVLTVEDGAFASNSQVDDLYLDGNEIQFVRLETFTGLSRLQRLFLQNNVITRLTARAFQNLGNLQQLWLHSNKIECLNEDSFVGLDSLRLLHLSNNKIPFLASNVFQSIPLVQYMILTNNQLDNLDTRPFRNLPNLFQLALFYNSIRSLPDDSFTGTESISYLQFNTAEGDFANDNAFVCDCQLNWLREYLETFLPYYISVFCADPEPYRGLKIQDVSMACESTLNLITFPSNEDVYIQEGQCLRLQCKPSKFLNVNWTRLDNELRAAGGAALCGVAGEADTCGNVHVDNDGVMAISSVDPSDSGYYMCSVTDSENELTVKKIFRVRVIDPSYNISIETGCTPPTATPATSLPPADLPVTSPPNQSRPEIMVVGSLQQDFRDPPSFVMFEVNITGSPRPDVSWSHDGEEIVVKGRYHLTTTGSLFLINLESSDSGLYVVRSTNQAGSASATFGLLIFFASSCNYGSGCLNNGSCEAVPFCLCPEGFSGEGCETDEQQLEPFLDPPMDDEDYASSGSGSGSGSGYYNQHSNSRRAANTWPHHKRTMPTYSRVKETVAEWKDPVPQETREPSPSSRRQDIAEHSGRVYSKPVMKMPSHDVGKMQLVEIPPPTTRKTGETNKAGSASENWHNVINKGKTLQYPSNKQLRKLY